MRNNFERLGDEYERDSEDVPGNIREDLEGSRSIFTFIGSITDLFIPKLFALVSGLLGARSPEPNSPIAEDDDEKPNKYPHLEGN